MSQALCVIGAATLDVIGLNPKEFDYKSKANWPNQAVFNDNPFYQPTGMGERILTLKLACRPHEMGGLDDYAILKQHHENQDVVMFMRLINDGQGLLGENMGQVAITDLSHSESKIAPSGLGYRHEFEATLTFVGDNAASFGDF
jgi:phage protein U